MIPQLNVMTKWWKHAADIKTGDVFLVMDDNLPRYRWPLGRVTSTFPGPDRVVRVVEIEVSGKIYRRGVRYLVPLEVTPAEAPENLPTSSAVELGEVQ